MFLDEHKHFFRKLDSWPMQKMWKKENFDQ